MLEQIEDAKFYVADAEKLKSAIDATGVSKSAIARAGKLSNEVLRKATKGERVSRVKAHGIYNGLTHHGYNGTMKDIFNKHS